MKNFAVEDARKQLPELVERAYLRRESCVITRHGVPYAVLGPLDSPTLPARETVLSLRGSGAGCCLGW